MDKVETKTSNTDLVTETDKAVEKLIIVELSHRFPSHKFIGEETAATGQHYELTDAPTWIIDPIDGTTNFVHRIGLIAICVGLAVGKKMKAGIVYNPITDELFSAQEGRGASKNGFPIRVSSTEAINKAIVCSSLGIHNVTEKGEGWLSISTANQLKITKAGVHGTKGINSNFGPIWTVTTGLQFYRFGSEIGRAVTVLQLGSDRSPPQMNSFLSNFKTLMGDQEMHGHRAFGSAAVNMVYVAQGSVDAYVEYGLHCWDMAAAAVIVKEAGGILIDPTGARSEYNLLARKVLCAGTEKLARELSGLLTHVDFDPE